MTDYSELVKALRLIARQQDCNECEAGRWYNEFHCCLFTDSADAIEALQAEQKKTVTQIFGEEQQKWTEYCTALGNRIKELEQQMPKRGKWIEDATTYAGPGLSNYKCSLCGKICGTWRRGLKPSELPNWCGYCGADLRAKMEVQDG